MIKVFLDCNELDINFMTFNGGERNVKILGYKKPWTVGKKSSEDVSTILIEAYLTSSDEVMDLLLLEDALMRLDYRGLRKAEKNLHLAYFPYARQDRVMVDGEALSSSVMAKLINSMNFDVVIVNDPHSDVAPALINNVVVIPQDHDAVNVLGEGFFSDAILVAPDAGAIKKVNKLAKLVGHSEIGVGNKTRNLQTNEISNSKYFGPSVEGKRVIMIDDCLDGGRTFIELGRILKEQGAKEVVLYVTHALFSYGADVFAETVDEVYCAYYWNKNVENRNTLGIFKKVDNSVSVC